MLCYLLDVNHACSTSISYLSLSPVIGALLEIEQDLIRPTNGSSDFSLSDLRNILTRLWTVAESQRSSFSSFRGSKVEWIHVSRLCDLKRPGELSGPTKCQKAGTKTQSGTKFKVSSAISKWVLTSHIFFTRSALIQGMWRSVFLRLTFARNDGIPANPFKFEKHRVQKFSLQKAGRDMGELGYSKSFLSI